MYMDTTVPNTNVNTHTFCLSLKIPYIHSWTDAQIKPPKRIQTLGLKVVSTQTDIVECYVGQSVVKH